MTMILYDLACEDTRVRFSPHCWKVRMALAHKGLEAECVPWHYMQKDLIKDSWQGAVPVLQHQGKMLADSWNIACYLEQSFPDTPSIFGAGEGLKPYAKFINHWVDAELLHAIGRLIVTDIHANISPDDRAYYRRTREQRWGQTLEAFTQDRDNTVHDLRKLLEPLRSTLSTQPFLAGDHPAYPDYCVFGYFMWARTVSGFELLDDHDPINSWRDYLLDAFDGLARKAPRSRLIDKSRETNNTGVEA